MLTEQQFKPLMEEQGRRIYAARRQYAALLEQRLAEAKAQDLATFVAVMGTLAGGLNAYAASLPQPPIIVREWTPPTPLPRSASTVGCTYRLWALGGMMLCVNSDGSVVAR